MKEENKYRIDLEHFIIYASSPEEAENKAQTKINNSEVEIKSVTEL